MKTITQLVQEVKAGDYPEVRLNENVESLSIMSDDVKNTVAIIMANALMSDIPEELVRLEPGVLEMRKEYYDHFVEVLNTTNRSRVKKIHEHLDNLETIIPAKCWSSLKIRNNVYLFVKQVFVWNEETRIKWFVGDNEETAEEVESETLEVETEESK